MWGARGITVAFHTGRGPAARTVTALADVDLDVAPGRVTAVVGGDGAGKSTLLRALLGRVPLSGGLTTMPSPRDIGYQPATSGVWRTLSVEENLDFVGAAHGLAGADLAARKDLLLAGAGLADARDRLGGRLSGGMRQKLGFCLAMLHGPRVLLLDEPSTGVDPVSRVELWRLVAETAANGTAVVMTTTYLDEAERAGTVVVLDEGSVLAAGDPRDIRASVPGAIVVASVAPSAAGAGDRRVGPSAVDRTWRRGTRFHTWDPGEAPTRLPDLEDAVIALTLARSFDRRGVPGPGTVVREPSPPSTVPGPGAVPGGRALIDVERVVKGFGPLTAVDGVSLTVAPGEIVGLLGANGAGKTTLIRMILGLESADSGRIETLGSAPSRADRHALGYVPQGLGLSLALTVDQNVEFVVAAFGVDGVPPLPGALAAVRDRPVAEIGLGRQRQLAFHCALLHAPRLLVLDEPTSGVDPLARARLWDVVHAQADAGVGILVTTHYMQEAEQCTRLQVMAHGLPVAAGTVRDVTAGHEAVVVRTDAWQEAFGALGDAGFPVVLDGRATRVAGTDPDDVRSALASAGIVATCEVVPATVEETMVLVDRRTRDRVGGGRPTPA